MEIMINNAQDKYEIEAYEKLIIEAFKTAAKLENLEGELEVSLSLVDDSAIRRLNSQYRNLDEPTDVLSFPQTDGEEFKLDLPGLPRMLGDIIISLDRAHLQAEEYGHSIEREMVYLALHGFFHLLGYDHQTKEEEKVMRAKEENVLRKLNLRREGV